MELPKLKKTFIDIIQKYKFVLFVLCIGLILILLPTGTGKSAEISSVEKTNKSEHISQEDLASVLSMISGAGRVEVLLALENSAQTDYQLDKDGSGSTNERLTTVTVTDAQRNENGLIIKTGAPTYRGAIVVCDGADDPAVHLSVVHAVSNITGLRSDQISVLKMK